MWIAWCTGAGCVLAGLVLTEIAYSHSRRLGGHPPKDRWHSGQPPFWRYIREHSRRANSKLLFVFAVGALMLGVVAIAAAAVFLVALVW